jgi:glycogen debranching enzyme
VSTVDDPLHAGADFHIQASSQAAAIRKLVLKHDDAFLVSDRHGDFPAHFDGELGFYVGGTRHLRWFELRVNGERPLLLDAGIAPDNDQILVALTNADIAAGPEGGGPVPRNTIYLDRRVSLYGARLFHVLSVVSFHETPCELYLEILFNADFRDVFEVRGMHRPARGVMLDEERDERSTRLRYRGLDGVVRTTTLEFIPTPRLIAATRAQYRLTLEPHTPVRIELSAAAAESRHEPPPPVRVRDAVPRLRASAGRLQAEGARIASDNPAFNALLARSFADLSMLLTETPEGRLPYAGVPWYVCPFGRDAIITSLQLLPYHPDVAAATLRFLARWQGRTVNAFLDEEPGKILHEYRQGEMANCREIPFIPYYGTIDATPLFVVLLGEYVRWTGDLGLARALWPAARAALRWMREHGDADGDGYLEYAMHSPIGLTNQGWKDSGDAVMHADGRLAPPPIALVEVQGYAYAAWMAGADVAELLGEAGDAAGWRRQAATLHARFNEDFWMEQEGFYALALDGRKQPCEVVSSNPGHCLWTGIIDERRAPAVAKRLLAEDMFSGWGIRTLAARERRYNPMSYHNGSVWPHDNALAAAGFRRHRLPEHALTVATALFEAARWFEHARIPELFCGFPRHADRGPISYPVACAPQAWAAGAAFQVLTALVGLQADAHRRHLTLVNPLLPPWLNFVEITDLRVGEASLDLGIRRGHDGAAVELLGRRGDAELIVRR